MESVIITYLDLKKSLLKKRKSLVNETIMSMEELQKNLLFTYDEKAIYYLMKKYHYKYDVALTYLKNLIYGYKHDSLLSNIKKELEQENLLIINPLFQKKAEQMLFTTYHYPLTKWDKKVLQSYQYQEDNTPISNKKYKVEEYESIEEEVDAVARHIIQLIKQNVPINQIKLANVTEEYIPIITRIFKFYYIPIEIETSLYAKKEVHTFLNTLRETKDKEKSIQTIQDKDTLLAVIAILNKYAFLEQVDETLIEIVENECKNKKYPYQSYQNKIEFINHIEEDTYVFLLGFNDTYPRYDKDEDYLSDIVKKQIGIDTSIEKNKILEEQLVKEYSHAKEILFTYSKKINNNKYQISPISANINFSLQDKLEDTYRYSPLYNKIKLAKLLDEKNKFNHIDPNLHTLLSYYPDLPYQTYDNSFTGIQKEKILEFLHNKLLLSYSSIDNYYKCGFKYYLNNLLKITPFEETFALKIGNIFHEVLEKMNNPSFNYEQEFGQVTNSMEFTKKEEILLIKLKKDLAFVIETIQKQNYYTTFTEELHEKKVYVNKDKTISVTFMGVIDKLKYTKKDNKTLVAIIDYKTGSPITNLTKTLYGLDMQLPIYLYLAQNMQELKEVEVVGIYLQKILNNDCAYDPKKSYEKQKEEHLKLDGYSIADEELLSLFDKTYQDSEVIKSMKTTKNGFYAYSKIITKEQMKALTTLVDQKIEEARDHILEADFVINPKKMEKETTCKYCPYIDICHRKEEDFITIKVPRILDL